ncbi:MAG: iron-sulfur cluster carrier protein ApbC [Alphaproteobacteria bacterium]|jgi:ATP-binding protein involved in chromosome partitioning|nr:iron-sulfur cluster carrier protein ApbC [Alphaproteobacteria bacterium]
MAVVSESQVLDALRCVPDPDRGGDIVSLDMVSGLTVKDGHVLFSIEVDPERGPRLEPLRQAAERTVQALPGVLSVTAMLTAHRQAGQSAPQGAPPGGPAAGSAAGQAANRRGGGGGAGGRIEIEGVKAIIAVASGKGGVGKSTTAVNLAVAFGVNGQRVGLLDADIYGPSMPRMMAISGKPTSPDGQRIDPMHKHGVSVMSIGFMVPEDTPMIWRGPMVQSALTQMLRDVNWGELDVLVVDMPPGTGDAQLTMAQSVPLSGAVIVSTPQDIALLDARKGLNMFRKVDVPVLGIIENMSYFACPHCGGRSEIFGYGGAKAEAERLGCEFLGEVPLDLHIREASDAGEPIVLTQPESEHAAIFRAMAGRLWAKLADPAAAGVRQAPRILIQ